MFDARDFSEQLEVFFGAASAAACRVYARLTSLPADADLRLRGRLTGPQCRFARTLASTFHFVDRGGAESLLAEAFIPEPCAWTPQLPQLYESQIELVRGDDVLAVDRRLLGLRMLGTAGRSLYYQAQRWVLRGVSSPGVAPDELPLYRESEAALVVDCPEDDLCQAASREGVLLVARLAADQVSELRRLSRWPAVGIVALPRGLHLDLHGWRHNLLLAEWQHELAPAGSQPWAQIAVFPVDEPVAAVERIAETSLPVIAARTSHATEDVRQRRGLCDLLQRDLALAAGGQCDPAGYIV